VTETVYECSFDCCYSWIVTYVLVFLTHSMGITLENSVILREHWVLSMSNKCFPEFVENCLLARPISILPTHAKDYFQQFIRLSVQTPHTELSTSNHALNLHSLGADSSWTLWCYMTPSTNLPRQAHLPLPLTDSTPNTCHSKSPAYAVPFHLPSLIGREIELSFYNAR
jgi:hypothetical protein